MSISTFTLTKHAWEPFLQLLFSLWGGRTSLRGPSRGRRIRWKVIKSRSATLDADSAQAMDDMVGGGDGDNVRL